MVLNRDRGSRGARPAAAVRLCSADPGRGRRRVREQSPRWCRREKAPRAPSPRPGRAGGSRELLAEGEAGESRLGSSAERALWRGSLRRTRSCEEVAAQPQGASARSTNLLEAAAASRPTWAPGTEILARLSLPLFLDSSAKAPVLPGVAHVHAGGAEPPFCPPRISAQPQGAEPRGLPQGQTRSQGDPSFLRQEARAGSGDGRGRSRGGCEN